MDELHTGRLHFRSLSRREVLRHMDFTKNMFFAAIAASLAIVGAGAFFVSLWI